MGQPAARISDMHTCPMSTGPVPHVGGPIAAGAPTVLIGGLPAARVGDMATCVGPPDTIVKGNATVLICGMPAARMGDSTAHGGVIVVGCPTVLIGDDAGGASIVYPVAAPQRDPDMEAFEREFKEMTGMSLEDSIILYKNQTIEVLTADKVRKLFKDSGYAKEQLMADKNLHTVYREILNTNIPPTEKEAQNRNFTKMSFLQTLLHDPLNNNKYIDSSGHLEAVYDSQGDLVSSKDYLGTFNFFDPNTQPSEHWAADMEPWWEWGN